MGGLETVARVTRDLSSAIDKGELVAALDALDQAPAGQRLGFVFQCLGYDTLANHVFKWWHAAATPYANPSSSECRLANRPRLIADGTSHSTAAE